MSAIWRLGVGIGRRTQTGRVQTSADGVSVMGMELAPRSRWACARSASVIPSECMSGGVSIRLAIEK